MSCTLKGTIVFKIYQSDMEQDFLIEKQVIWVENPSFVLECSILSKNVGSKIQIQRRF